MNLQQFLLILRARYKLVLLVLLGTVTATLGVSLVLPKQYTATTSVVIDVKSPDPVIGMMLPGMAAPGYMATQIDIIQSDRVAQKVVKLLKLDANPTVRQQWMEATKGKGKLEIVGDLTLRGTTKPVTLDAEMVGAVDDPWGNKRMGFSARAKIDRMEYGVKWNKLLDAGGFVAGHDVDIQIEIESVMKKAK